MTRKSRTPLHKWFFYASVFCVVIAILALPSLLAQHLELQTGYFAIAATSLALLLASFVELRFDRLEKKLDKILDGQQKADQSK
jgi:hypothetical protein